MNSAKTPKYGSKKVKKTQLLVPKTHVLSVGINSFHDPQIKNLQTAVSDAVQFLTGFRNAYHHGQLIIKKVY